MDNNANIIDMLKDSEPYMNENHLMYFKDKLISQRRELEHKIVQSRQAIKALETNHSDIVDRTNHMMDIASTISTHHRYGHLLKEIDRALERIENGTFGYCSLSGNEIGLKRLEILPCTCVSIEALEELNEL